MTKPIEISNKYKMNPPFPELEVFELLDFKDYPILSVEKNPIGTLYLSYLHTYIENNLENRFLIETSSLRLTQIKAGEIDIKSAFNNAENKVIYSVHIYTDSGNIKTMSKIPVQDFKNINPIPENYLINVQNHNESSVRTKEQVAEWSNS